MSKISKKEIEKLQKDLKHNRVSVWDQISVEENKKVDATAAEYMDFLSKAVTERRAVSLLHEKALEAGFVEAGGKADKIVINHRGKVAAIAWLGKKPISEGVRIIGSHLDSPRLDLKPRPVFENEQVGFFKTHYYGGIKKYHWVGRPLALVGPVIKKDGTVVELEIGLKPNDPVFTIADLLPHLSGKAQDNKKATEIIHGEKLNIIVGVKPFGDKEVKERIKLNVLKYLKDNYSIAEEDFISADLEVVPAEKPREVGFDRELIGGYGHDDRICAWTSFAAAVDFLKNTDKPNRPGLILFMDKEEIGSMGNTGTQSKFIEFAVGEMIRASGEKPSGWAVQEALFNSWALSADTPPCMDPDWQEVHEKRNAALLGYGTVFTKFTGSGGKRGTSDANAEFVAWIRKIMADNNIIWQSGIISKVDEGGGGTVAKFLAKHGMEVIDIGVPILGMHSPFELVTKVDMYMTMKTMNVFLEAE